MRPGYNETRSMDKNVKSISLIEAQCFNDAWSEKTITETFSYDYNHFVLIDSSGRIYRSADSGEEISTQEISMNKTSVPDEISGLSDTESDKNEIAGYVIYSVVCDEAELLRIAVSDRYRRNGFGRRLMQEFLGSLEGKADSVYLEVRSGNEAAIGLYKGAGFEVVGVRKNYYRSPDEDAVLMKKTMTNQI